MKLQKGFTLIELMIVVAIIAILAAVSIPAYSDYVRRSKITEATSMLSGLRVNMEQYYQDNRTYLNAGGACGVAMPNATEVKYFTLTCPAATATPTTYILTATGTGSMAGFVYTIDQSNAKTTNAVPAGSGWILHNPNSCWVTKSGGVC